MQSRTIDDVITTIALKQHGVVTRAQLLCAGVPPDVIDRRTHAGRLVRVHRGVYQVGLIAAPRAREMAAVLACGTHAVLSHTSAATCWRILPAQPEECTHV